MEASNAIHGSATLDAADFKAMCGEVNRRLGLHPFRVTTWSVVALFIAADTALNNERTVAYWALAIGIVLFLAVIPLSRAMRRRGTPCYIGERSYGADASGIEVTEPDLATRYAWSHFNGITETASHLLLAHGQAVLAIPRRAFDAQGYAALTEFARTNIAARKA